MGRPASVDTEARVRFTPFTSDPGNEVDPALSASGRLAYVARGADGRAHLFTKMSSDARAVQVTDGAARQYAPVWSPDETQLAFVEISERGCAIRVASADLSRVRDLVECLSPGEHHMSWSPDGSSLAVTAGAGTFASPAHIEIVAVADGSRRKLTEPPPAHIGDISPAFSPDGRQLAFVRSISGGLGDVFVAAVDGGAATQVTADNADVLGVDWEPDGRHLVFSSDRSGGINLWRVPVGGGEPALVAGGSAKVKHPSVARRAGSIAYEDWHYDINLIERGVEDAAAPAAVSPTSDRWNFHAQISLDGERLAFQSTRSGDYLGRARSRRLLPGAPGRWRSATGAAQPTFHPGSPAHAAAGVRVERHRRLARRRARALRPLRPARREHRGGDARSLITGGSFAVRRPGFYLWPVLGSPFWRGSRLCYIQPHG